MAHGGKRKGAGRPKGSLTRKTLEIAHEAIAGGKTPLEIMLNVMAKFCESGELEKAASVAKDAAPYIHPRLQAIEHSGKEGGPIQVMIARDDAELL